MTESISQQLKPASFPTFSELPVEIFDKICSYLDVRDFLATRKVCKRFNRVESLQEYFNINRALRPFVSDPFAFRSELGKQDALISGVFALGFFGSASSSVQILDLFVKVGAQADGLVTYTEDREGYEKKKDPENTTDMERFLFSNGNRPGMTVRLTATRGLPVEAILRYSYTTNMVNMISWNKAYSAFPKQTLIYHKFHALRFMDDAFGDLLTKQSHVGWLNQHFIWPVSTTDARYRINNGYRRVGGQSSFVVPLDINNVKKASTPDSVIEFVQFQVYRNSTRRYPSEVSEWRGISQIRVQPLTSPALRRAYTFTGSCRTFLEDQLRRWVWFEMRKLKEAERPVSFANPIPLNYNIPVPDDFQPPDTWLYADDQIPVWYQEWEQRPVEKHSVSGAGKPIRPLGRH